MIFLALRPLKTGWLMLVGFFLLVACQKQAFAPNPISGPLPELASLRLGRGTITTLTLDAANQALYVGSEVGIERSDARDLAEQWQVAVEKAVRATAVSGDGRWLLAGLDNGTLLLLNGEDGALLQRLPGHAGDIGISALAWQPTAGVGEYLAAVGYDDGRLKLLRMAGEQVEPFVELPRQGSRVTSLTFSPQGHVLASAQTFGDLVLIDVTSGVELGVLADRAENGAVVSLAWSPSGEYMLSGNTYGRVVEWDLTRLGAIDSWPAADGEVLAVDYLFDGQAAAAAASGGEIEQRSTRQTVEGLRLHTGTQLLAAVWNRTDGTMITAGSDGLLRRWPPLAAGVWPPEPTHTRGGHAPFAQQVSAVVYNRQGTKILANLGSLIRIWDADQARLLVENRSHEAPVTAAAWSPDGQLVASADRLGRIVVWQAETGQHVRELVHHSRPVSDLSWSPDGKRLASAGSLADDVVIWDIRTGEVDQVLHGDGDGLWSVAWSPDGRQLAAGSAEGKLFLWDSNDYSAPAKAWVGHRSWISDLAWAGTGRLLSGSGDRQVVLWDFEAPDTTVFAEHLAPVRAVAVDPQGRMAVSGAVDGEAIIWNTDPNQQGEIMNLFQGHTDGITAVDWSPDGMRIATGSDDGTVLLWDVSRLLAGD